MRTIATRRIARLLVTSSSFALAMGLCFPSAAADRTDAGFPEVGVPFLKQHCLDCHSGSEPEAELSLAEFRDDASVLKNHKLWDNVIGMVETGGMPPEDAPRPTVEQREAFLRAVRGVFARAARDAKPDPGRVTMRRLNRTEYRNTIRDLVGVDFDPTEDFPSDDIGHGFDNIGDVLTMSPVLMERYLAAAEAVMQRTFQGPPDKQPARERGLLACAADKPQAEQTREILRRFASRAYRRPATTDEVERLAKLAESALAAGQSWESGLQLAMQAVLCSPKFLFRAELDDRPDSAEVRALDEHQLASRLSYFLWSTMPDEELSGLAEKNQLRANLDAQVRRMLQDPKSESLVENFALQWLQLKRLETFAPDPQRFPRFGDRMRSAMLEETKRFFASVMREDRSILDLLDADYTFLNERLARHYGIVDTQGTRAGKPPVRPGGQPIRGDEFVRVKLTDSERGGLLTQASVLTVTSNPTRTSPVKRGQWVLEQILGTPPPPPPANVPALPEGSEAELTGSLRQRFEQHRSNPVCANCHARMDPIGFAFENYDAVGAYRTKDGAFDIDTAGELPDGRSFQTLAELKEIIKGKKDEFARCLAEKMLIYALGRGLEHYDLVAVDRIVQALKRDDYRFSTLVLEIVRSDPFQKRRGT
ncbi:MAG TPA: DUF1592 domain-containing protein [Candidatus Anammoximicrobium sp.]|nr:DUF1592 domain-containing protein [Candidatus Anammoximicrobium sp.]